jgi:predicted MFS family arabinose efflux permease
MTPTALSIVSTLFPEGAERNKALAIWGMNGAFGATAGYVIGGVLVDGPGWEWVFLINVPVGLAALALSPGLLRESQGALTHRSYDPAGALRLLRSRTLVGANAVMLLFATVGFGMPFVLTLYAQQVLGYSPLEFGVGFVVTPVAAAVGMIVAQAAVPRLGFGTVAASGMALLAVSRSEGYLAANEGANQLAVLTEGFQSAFVACVVLAAIGVALALVLLRRQRKEPHARLEPVPAS